MALSHLYDSWPDSTYKQRIDTWLTEGIDIDADGQFTERSSSVYSPLTDRCLITIARIMDKPELYKPVRRNLKMSAYYIHPNGEVVTEASRRQDQYRARKPGAYYYPYRYMSLRDRDTLFGGVTEFLEATLSHRELSHNLIYLYEDTILQDRVLPGSMPDHYNIHFPQSELVRIREGEHDATILARNPAFFTMHNHNAVLQAIRLATAFFGKGQFAADSLIVKEDGSYRLEQSLSAPYYQPISPDLIPGDGNWEKMPRDQRPRSEVQHLHYVVDVIRQDSGYILDFSITGTDGVPVALELAFRKGGELMGVTESEREEQSYFLQQGYATYRFQDHQIMFGPAMYHHRWTQLRGAEPKLDALSVYLTGYTPFHYRLEIR